MPPKKLLELINEVSKVAGYKVDIQTCFPFRECTVLMQTTLCSLQCPGWPGGLQLLGP